MSRFNEAPIHESGKSRDMLEDGRLTAASMRPRFMNRGSIMLWAHSSGRSSGFNEAPIHESGKCDAWERPGCWVRRGFNEAPIHESGKS